MESAKRWFSKLGKKDKPKPPKKQETTSNGKEGSKLSSHEETPSTATKQKVAAAKQYIEKHYKEQMKSLQERRERYVVFLLINDCELVLSFIDASPCNQKFI